MRLGVLCLVMFLAAGCGDRHQKNEKTVIVHVNPPGREAETVIVPAEKSISRRSSDTLFMGYAGEPEGINPFLIRDTRELSLCGLIFEGLLSLDGKGDTVPLLADEYTRTEDGTCITFNLRKDAYWQDGGQFTAVDVSFTYQLILDGYGDSRFRESLANLSRIEAGDLHTVHFRFRTRFDSSFYPFTAGIIPEHIFQGRELSDPAINSFPIGTGPFQLREWIRGSHLILKANEEYYLGKPEFIQSTVSFYPDEVSLFGAFRARTLDMLILENGFIEKLDEDQLSKSRCRLIPAGPGWTWAVSGRLGGIKDGFLMPQGEAYRWHASVDQEGES